MDHRQSKRSSRSTNEADDKNTKHRKIDDCVTMTQKEKRLLQRRLKYRQAATNRLLANINHVNPIKLISQIQDDFTVGVSCSTSETVTERSTIPSLDVSDKGKDLLDPFHVFEKGSTSGTANESRTQPLDQS
ncbi:hypothetical protein A4A49_01486 [Nicotiana attenuata]|uniref:Uncharacterized protein n=1 Tax=Nicotiana attenuata TaxID=49451 RepID=A0A1J6I0I6_NICAT|nr:hypothetical protein A4A49_01486 [Nicotiana attenuata]